MDGGTAHDYVPDNNDFYYLHRIRLNITLTPLKGITIFVQPQWTEAPGFRSPVLPSVEDRVDFRAATVEYVTGGPVKWGVKAGRQELNFGAQRLIGSANWGNTSRGYEGVRLSREDAGLRLDLFFATVLQTRQYKLDYWRNDFQLYGFHASSKKWVKRGLLELYTFRKIAKRDAGELGRAGRSDHYTVGARGVGKLPLRLDYNFETAVQAGDLAGMAHRGWAGYWVLGYRVRSDESSPRLMANFSHASGDRQPGDGKYSTFDQLYPTNHQFYGYANRVSWRNMNEAMAGLDWRPYARMIVNFQYHSVWLATRKDAFYNFNGRAQVRNPNASSNHLWQEFDINAVWDLRPELQFTLGFTHIFPGAYIRESTRGSSVTAPYLQWKYTF